MLRLACDDATHHTLNPSALYFSENLFLKSKPSGAFEPKSPQSLRRLAQLLTMADRSSVTKEKVGRLLNMFYHIY